MIKFSYDLKIGRTVIHIEDEAASQKELFEKVSPMQAVEIAANGKDDVYLSVRTTRGGDKYYALVCPSEGLEFPFGVLKDGGGALFPGKYNKAEKKTVQRWLPLQHGTIADPEDDPEGEKEPQPQPKPSTARASQSGRSSAQGHDNVLQLTNRALSPEEKEKRALTLVASQAISVANGKYTVKVNDAVSYAVSQISGKVACNCERFKVGGDCEHILAVRKFCIELASRQREELKMLIVDLINAGLSTDAIDAAIARVCDGICAIDELTPTQIAKAVRTLQGKMEDARVKAVAL